MGQRTVIDMMGREILVPDNPQRIISLVPSQTELLFDLGLSGRVVGITWFCIHPADIVKNIPKIGGTKNLKLDKIRELLPDLIIANKEENERSQVEQLAQEFPVWVSDISTIDDSIEMIKRVGGLTGTASISDSISQSIIESFSFIQNAPPLRTLYLIWKDPFMSVGSDTFIHHILDRIGLQNVCSNEVRYPELIGLDIKTLTPDLILLSSEPYPFGEKHILELQSLVPNSRIMLVDGEMFSWYGSRLIKADDYLRRFTESLTVNQLYPFSSQS